MTNTESSDPQQTAVATIDNMTFEEIAKLTGQNTYSGEARSTLPWLSINRQAEDDDGNATPIGTYVVDFNGVKVYSKTATLRPFIRGFQYRKYDPVEKATTSKTRIIKSWSEEAFDSTGTIKCGRPKIAKNEFPTPDQAEIIKQVRCYMMVFGVLTMAGVDKDGNPVSVENLPVGFRIRGLSYQAMDTIIKDLEKRKRLMVRTEIQLALKRGKNGDNVYYSVVPSVNYTSPNVWRATEDSPILNDFQSYINVINASIYDEYKKALGETTSNAEAMKVVGGRLKPSKSLDDDFIDDDVSDIGQGEKNLSAG